MQPLKLNFFSFWNPSFCFCWQWCLKNKNVSFGVFSERRHHVWVTTCFQDASTNKSSWRTTVLKIKKFSQRWNQLPVTEFALLQFLLEALFCVCLPPPAPTCRCPAPSDAPSVRQQILNKLYHYTNISRGTVKASAIDQLKLKYRGTGSHPSNFQLSCFVLEHVSPKSTTFTELSALSSVQLKTHNQKLLASETSKLLSQVVRSGVERAFNVLTQWASRKKHNVSFETELQKDTCERFCSWTSEEQTVSWHRKK